MFRLLGTLAGRFSWSVVAFWLVLSAAVWLFAPDWQRGAQDSTLQLLPPDIPSRQAARKFQEAFPDDQASSSIVLVLQASGPATLEQLKHFVLDVLEPRLRELALAEGGIASELTANQDDPFAAAADRPRPLIERIRTPNTLGAGVLLTSDDQRAALVVIDLGSDLFAKANRPLLLKVEGLLDELRQAGQLPAGISIDMTGTAVVGRDYVRAQRDSARATEWLAVVLVVALLVIVYRAPFLALIPLVTVFLAVKLALGLLAFLAAAGHVTLFEGLQIYITVVAYGAGVDYCLFLTARYREELQHADSSAAIARTVAVTGPALVASAGTVMVGIGMMVFASFGKFHDVGIAMPFSLLIVLLMTLSFSPALLRIASGLVFWQPFGAGRKSADEAGPVWRRVGQQVCRRPGAVWLACLGLMLPFAILGLYRGTQLNYTLVGRLPDDAVSAPGTKALRAHFPPGMAGQTGLLLVNSKLDFSEPADRALADRLTRLLETRADELKIADVRSLTRPLGLHHSKSSAFSGIEASPESIDQALDEQARLRYVSSMGGRNDIATRFDIVHSVDPLEPENAAFLHKIEEALRQELGESAHDAELFSIGPMASGRDMAAVAIHDQQVIEILALAGVFVILMLLLRRLVLSSYLLLSVLFSYYTTLGVAYALFWSLDPAGFQGLDWKVGVFLFTILIAVGEDYNIFLMSRVWEEQARHGRCSGIIHALVKTGPIISSCGIIMAGTFASLLGGSLHEMRELGFALAFGVLLDTFAVRPLLVPAFLMLTERRGRAERDQVDDCLPAAKQAAAPTMRAFGAPKSPA